MFLLFRVLFIFVFICAFCTTGVLTIEPAQEGTKELLLLLLLLLLHLQVWLLVAVAVLLVVIVVVMVCPYVAES